MGTVRKAETDNGDGAKRARVACDAELFPRPFRVLSACPEHRDAGEKLIGTHDGTFHCDEALGCAMLQMMPAFSGATVVRTRNEAELAKCDIVIDVGAVYDHAKLRYDHHQRTFDSKLSDEHPDVPADARPAGFTTKLSASGLVYKHYGLTALLPALTKSTDLPETMLPVIYKKMYEGFVEEIDAIDNGVEVSDGELKYKISTNLSARVGQLNPLWNEDGGKETRNELFKEAMALTMKEFRASTLRLCTSWYPARSIVEAAVANRKDVHESGEIMRLDRFCPWQGHLSDLETEQGIVGVLKYVLFEDSGGSWRVQAVAKEGFTSRKALPGPWRGIRDAELSALTGIDGCIFCHASGFIGGNKSREGAFRMATAALAFKEEK